MEENLRGRSPPTQIDWVIFLQRFKSADTAVAWLHSSTRQKLIAQVQPMLVGEKNPAALNLEVPVLAHGVRRS